MLTSNARHSRTLAALSSLQRCEVLYSQDLITRQRQVLEHAQLTQSEFILSTIHQSDADLGAERVRGGAHHGCGARLR